MSERSAVVRRWVFGWAMVGGVALAVWWLSCRPDDRPKGLQIGPDGQPHWVPMTDEEAAKPWDGKRFAPPKR